MDVTDACPIAELTPDDRRWDAVTRRDPQADGSFVYSVRTTGVYCRPSCPSRQARRENVAFHTDRAAAARAGFRACLRCRPDDATATASRTASIAAACRFIDEAESPPSLDALAKAAGLSPSHFQRTFKAETGLTPRGYAQARRVAKASIALRHTDTITEAIYASGFNAASRFYQTTASHLGMTPTAYRAGGSGASIRFAVGQCALGAILVAMTPRGVCAILLGDDPDALVHDLQNRFPNADLIGGDGDFERMVAQVVGFVEAPRLGLALPLDIGGTAFQQRVWDALQTIGPGETRSYAQVAAMIGAPSAARAVAAACGANPIAVAIPCHRVVRSDGALSGYRWGIARKRDLLERERESAVRPVQAR